MGLLDLLNSFGARYAESASDPLEMKGKGYFGLLPAAGAQHSRCGHRSAHPDHWHHSRLDNAAGQTCGLALGRLIAGAVVDAARSGLDGAVGADGYLDSLWR